MSRAQPIRPIKSRGGQSLYGAPFLSHEERKQRRAYARQWHLDNKPYFDALYSSATIIALPTVADHRAAARQWRIDNKPFFDAIYGPEQPCCACHRAVPA